MSLSPLGIINERAVDERAEDARLSSFIGVAAVGDLIKSTLGPRGMDKILQSTGHSKDLIVTNDGATIMKSIVLDNPAAKVLADISKVQDEEVGDGTTTVCVLAAELLKEGSKLVEMKIHPQIIIQGYRIACSIAEKVLMEVAEDHSSSPDKFKEDLIAIARTSLSSKIVAQDDDLFSRLAVEAVLKLKGSTNLDHIHIIKKVGGKLSDSYLDEGFILDKRIGANQPKRIKNAKIMISNTSMDTDKIKIFGARVQVDCTSKLTEIERAEREKMRNKVEKIKKHGINCFINRQLIYNWPEQLFAENGIVSIEHADFEGIERLSLVTGGEIVSTFDYPESVKLGYCDLIEEVMIGEDTLVKFSGVAEGRACTIVLRGSSNHIIDEAERSLHDAISAVSQMTKDPRMVYGGGCAEIIMAEAIDSAEKVAGKCSYAIEAFARALRQIPTIIAANAGYDSSEIVSQLRAAYYNGKRTAGIDIENGIVGDMRVLAVKESYKLKRHVLISSAEAAEMILRVGDIIKSAPRPRRRE